ncbi:MULTISPECIES: hypothetical protein [unclassified Roseovarius]|uniref:hypothetical protein n=1 Tax=unclassified Roseovarius TaxID=2614913 RepID=UPI00273EDF63|nr:hypothetical protein [Roseovarius sp. MMSF_3350]
MSAPETNLERQKKRHIGPLGGMLLVVAFVSILFGVFYILATSGDEVGDGAQAPTESTQSTETSVGSDTSN